jgi:hypothetical protein
MPSVIILSAVMASVVAPLNVPLKKIPISSDMV